jgi:hypothetical protein
MKLSVVKDLSNAGKPFYIIRSSSKSLSKNLPISGIIMSSGWMNGVFIKH